MVRMGQMMWMDGMDGMDGMGDMDGIDGMDGMVQKGWVSTLVSRTRLLASTTW